MKMATVQRAKSLKNVLALLLICMYLVCPCLAMTRSEALKELRVKSGFTDKELKSAYRKRSLETHPDKGGSNEEFVKVAEAYEVLSSGGSGHKFSSGTDGGGPRRSDDERMKEAEDMFFQMFEDFFEHQASDVYIDKLFGDPRQLSLSKRLVKSTFKWFAKVAVNKLGDLLENDSVTINVDGQTMSGADFKAWREKMRKRKKETARTSDL
mmetsp:Transcript_24458/g.37677  ORF Transcript_24458/g.37677 Transcript_24458/m.37677 type:complete len:210 (-) Transcript_24458:1295-1924(-)